MLSGVNDRIDTVNVICIRLKFWIFTECFDPKTFLDNPILAFGVCNQ